MANRMMQYLAALKLAEGYEDCAVTGHDISEWSMHSPSSRGYRSWPVINTPHMDIPWLRSFVAAQGIDRIRFKGVPCHLNHFPSAQVAAQIFDAGPQPHYETGPGDLVIHIRLEDVMVPGRHADYGPLPIDWYRSLIADTGLHPVFVGQIGDDIYSETLRAAFPEATILEGGSVLHDFQTLRNAHNIALAVGTFSWLASWLGRPRRIFYPMLGVMHPAEMPFVRLLTADDPRYECYEFPRRKWRADDAAIREVLTGPSPAVRIGPERLGSILAQADTRFEALQEAWKAQLQADLVADA